MPRSVDLWGLGYWLCFKALFLDFALLSLQRLHRTWKQDIYHRAGVRTWQWCPLHLPGWRTQTDPRSLRPWLQRVLGCPWKPHPKPLSILPREGEITIMLVCFMALYGCITASRDHGPELYCPQLEHIFRRVLNCQMFRMFRRTVSCWKTNGVRPRICKLASRSVWISSQRVFATGLTHFIYAYSPKSRDHAGLAEDLHRAGAASICYFSQALKTPFESGSKTYQHTVLNDPWVISGRCNFKRASVLLSRWAIWAEEINECGCITRRASCNALASPKLYDAKGKQHKNDGGLSSSFRREICLFVHLLCQEWNTKWGSGC